MLRDDDQVAATETSPEGAGDERLVDDPDRRRSRSARAAVAALFFTNGAAFANLIPRYPEIKDELGLGNAALGSAIAAAPAGALVAGVFASVLIGRFGSRRLAALGLVAQCGALALIPTAPGWAALAAVLAIVGGVDAVVDVAQNAHGLRVQRRYGRSIVNSFHGWWSIGAVTGGLMGSAAAGLSIPLAVHLVGTGIAFSAIAVATLRFLLSGSDSAERTRDAQLLAATEEHSAAPAPPRHRGVWRTLTMGPLLTLGVLAMCGAIVEDAGASWGAIYLRDELGVVAAAGGLVFVALQTAMTVGRLLGDRVVDRFGQRAVTRAGGVAVTAAMAAALTIHTPWAAVAGFAIAGLGVATLVPAAFHAADELPGLPAGAGLTVASWLLRVGFLLTPPIIGLVADASSLRVGLGAVVLAGLAILAAGRSLSGRTPRSATDDAIGVAAGT